MKLYGKAQEIGSMILEMFKNPELLPEKIAPIFLLKGMDIPSAKWSLMNRFIMLMNKTTDARGIRQWASVGRTVIKGCHAFYILAPCIGKKGEGEDEETYVYGFRGVPVFRYEDTQGDPIPQYESAQKFLNDLPFKGIFGIQPHVYNTDGSLGYYQPGSIGLSVANLSTWAHEIIHAADDKLGGLGNSRPDAEVVAEFGGAILLKVVGYDYDADLGGAYEYCKAWSGGSVEVACIRLLERACKCVDLILSEISENQRNEA